MHAAEVSRAWLYAHGDDTVEPAVQEAFLSLVQRRALGEPIAYITGTREFWSLPLQISPAVLIPRPETELLVESALEFIPGGADWRIADLGTGSGAIAIAIASERPQCEVHATELSEDALKIARANAERLVPGRIRFHHGSWLEPLNGRFQVIVSNPPYVDPEDGHLDEGDCRFEPRVALTPGEDALSAIAHISREAVAFLEPGGMLAFEHGFEQAEDVRRLLAQSGYTNISTHQDLAGQDRVTKGFKEG
jgi:release factor glutamine methyltransferase